MREQVVFKSRLRNLLLQDCKVVLDSVEVENWQEALREMQLCFKELLVALIGEHMGIDGFTAVLEQLLFKSHSEVKSNIVCVGFDGKGEEINLEINVQRCQILE